MNKVIGRLAVLALALTTACPIRQAAAADDKSGLVVEHAWIRATPKGAQVAGGYVTITNHGSTADKLTGGSTAIATRFELHTMTMDGGVMQMRPSGPMVIPPNGTLTLSPDGKHIMLTGLKHGLSKGETVDGTLTFEHAGTIPVHFTVEGVGARSSSSGHSAMPGMKM